MAPADERDADRSPDAMGEIAFRGDVVMKGCPKKPSATARIQDRSKDIVVSGGGNIGSIEVEDAFYRHPAVVARAVVARPDATRGEAPIAFVELKAGAAVTAAEPVGHGEALLAGDKVPRDMRFEPIPTTSTGKIRKFAPRERAEAGGAGS